MSVVPEEILALLDRATEADVAPSVNLARPTLEDLSSTRYSLALSSPTDAKLRHIPFVSLSFEQQEGEVASRVSAGIPDVDSDLGPLWELCTMGTPLWLLAGQSTLVEMFRGTIMEVGDRTTNGASFGIVAYDGLHNALRSKYDLIFGADTTLTEVIRAYAAKANIELGYIEEPGVKLGVLTMRQDTMIDGLTKALNRVAVLGGGSLKLRAVQGRLECIRPASNPVIYHFRTGGVAVNTTIKGSISDLINTVQVVATVPGSDEDDENAQVQVIKTLSSDAGFTGAQEMVYSAEADSHEAARLEAESILAEKGFPTWTYSHTGFAVPGVYKWERVHITDGIVDNHFIVAGLSMDLVGRTMQMSLTTTEEIARKTRQTALEAALADLKQTSASTGTASTGTTAGATLLKQIAKPVMGLAYVAGGAAGRTDFSKDMHHVGTDCSGFVSWMTRQLGGTTGTTTDAIAQASALIQTNGTDQAMPGDYILYWDGGASQTGMAYPHVAMWLGGGQVLESGGSVKPSSIGIGSLLNGYSRYEVRRNDAVFKKVNATPTKTSSKKA
jgi:cell wall-associated NlpC family hydrolase